MPVTANANVNLTLSAQDLQTAGNPTTVNRAIVSTLGVNTVAFNGYIAVAGSTILLSNLTTAGVLFYLRHAGLGDGMVVNSTIAGTARADQFGPGGIYMYYNPKPTGTAGTITIQNLSVNTAGGTTQPVEVFIAYI